MFKKLNKIIIAGGSGQLGKAIAAYFENKAEEIIILSRKGDSKNGKVQTRSWNGKDPGVWQTALENADVLINLTGKNVNCRHTPANKTEILHSRIDSVKALAQAVALCKMPPKLWVQASAGAIYNQHSSTPATETSETTGNGFMADVCQQWEKTFLDTTQNFTATRKIILRLGVVLGKHEGAFPKLKLLAKLGLGGQAGSGKQYMSWIHEADVVSLIDFIVQNTTMNGVVNTVSPNPLTNKEFMRVLRNAVGMPIGLPAPAFALKLGARLIGTEASIILDSMWMEPYKLVGQGFSFNYPNLQNAVKNLLEG